jgi:hypothetical protein
VNHIVPIREFGILPRVGSFRYDITDNRQHYYDLFVVGQRFDGKTLSVVKGSNSQDDMQKGQNTWVCLLTPRVK